MNGWLAAERSEAPVVEVLGHRCAVPQPPHASFPNESCYAARFLIP